VFGLDLFRFFGKHFACFGRNLQSDFSKSVWLYDIENDAKIITNNKYKYVNISKEHTMIWFQKKPRKTVENIWPGLPVILKEFQIYAYPHAIIRSQGVIVEQICWIWSSFLIMGSIELSLQTAFQNYSAHSLTSISKPLKLSCRLHVQEARCEIHLRFWFVLVQLRRFDV